MKQKVCFGVLVLACVGMAVTGCTAVLKYAGSGLAGAHQAVQVAEVLLQTLDEAYDKLLARRGDPERQQEVTRALAVADETAAGIRQVLQGEAVDDARLNILAGQVDGIQALSKGLTR